MRLSSLEKPVSGATVGKARRVVVERFIDITNSLTVVVVVVVALIYPLKQLSSRSHYPTPDVRAKKRIWACHIARNGGKAHILSQE
jgi:hypothetical protein